MAAATSVIRAVARRRGSREPSYHVLFAVLALSAATYSVFQSVMVPALPEVRRELGTSAGATTWLITGYLVSASVATPIAGNLGDLFGKRRVLVSVLTLCAAGTILAGSSSSIDMLICARVVQGLAGAVFPLSFGIIRDAFPPRRVATGIAMISSILGIGGVVGITLAGPIIDAWGYHWLFWAPLGLVVLAAVAAAVVVPDSPPTPPARVDWLGAGLMACWLVAILVAVSEGPTWGWGDGRQLALLAAGVVVFAAWLAFERRTRDPMIDLRLMAHRSVWTANAAGLLYGYCLFTWLVLVPQFVETPAAAGYGFGASVAQGALYLLPSTVTMVLIGPVTGWIVSAVGARVALVLGTLVSGIALAALALVHDESWHVFVAAAFLGAGNGLCYGALPNLIVDAVAAERTGTATGMNVVFRNVGGALGSQVASSIVAATAVGAALPTERGFTLAFGLGAGAVLLALLLTLVMPTRARPMDVPPILRPGGEIAREVPVPHLAPGQVRGS
jgi:EmrB/QacA subfamily drug resistance transporter